MQLIPRTQTLAEINAALSQLVRDYECDPKDAWPAAERIATERLARFLRVDEAFALVKLVKTERVRCSGCNTSVPAAKASEGVCFWCANKKPREA